MKIFRTAILLIMFLIIGEQNLSAQNNTGAEKYGKTLNLGVGIGYYGYYNGNGNFSSSTPVIHADYEFDVAPNFTLAPFVTFYSYQNYSYWGNPNNPYRNYNYTQTVVPIGVKGTYYFDQLLKASSKWDFYLAASLGVAIQSTRWDNGYNGNTEVRNGTTGLYLDAHLGTEYHISSKFGLYLDLSTGFSTLGLAVHL